MDALKNIKREFSEFWYLFSFAFKWLFNYKELGIVSIQGEVLSVSIDRKERHKMVVLPMPYLSQVLWYKGEFLATDGGMLTYVPDKVYVEEFPVQGDLVEIEGTLVYNKFFKRKPHLLVNAHSLKRIVNDKV